MYSRERKEKHPGLVNKFVNVVECILFTIIYKKYYAIASYFLYVTKLVTRKPVPY